MIVWLYEGIFYLGGCGRFLWEMGLLAHNPYFVRDKINFVDQQINIIDPFGISKIIDLFVTKLYTFCVPTHRRLCYCQPGCLHRAVAFDFWSRLRCSTWQHSCLIPSIDSGPWYHCFTDLLLSPDLTLNSPIASHNPSQTQITYSFIIKSTPTPLRTSSIVLFPVKTACALRLRISFGRIVSLGLVYFFLRRGPRVGRLW